MSIILVSKNDRQSNKQVQTTHKSMKYLLATEFVPNKEFEVIL